MIRCDVLVLGTGGVGSAAIYQLARRGVRVIGIDRFGPGHDRGSSHGETRMIRLAYYEHPSYVPLAVRSRQLWKDLEVACGKSLYHEVGVVAAGDSSSDVVDRISNSASQHGLQIDRLSPNDAQERWPALRIPSDFGVIFEPQAGFLLVEECVKAHLDMAHRAGGQCYFDHSVKDWTADGKTVTVRTDKEVFVADRLIVTAGAWAKNFLPQLPSLQIRRKPLVWYATKDDAYKVDRFPCYFFMLGARIFYGFPQRTEAGIKVAEHTGGEPVSDPLTVDRSLHTSDVEPLDQFVEHFFPHALRACGAHKVCMYTMSPDGDFLVGLYEESPQVAFTAGLSGHGFKFASVLGEIMADLAIDGATRHEIGFLSPNRFRCAM